MGITPSQAWVLFRTTDGAHPPSQRANPVGRLVMNHGT